MTGHGFARPNQEPELGWFFPPFWQSFQCWNASSRQPSLASNGASTVTYPTIANISGRWRTKFDGRRATSFSISPTSSNFNLASTHGSLTHGIYGPLSTVKVAESLSADPPLEDRKATTTQLLSNTEQGSFKSWNKTAAIPGQSEKGSERNSTNGHGGGENGVFF